MSDPSRPGYGIDAGAGPSTADRATGLAPVIVLSALNPSNPHLRQRKTGCMTPSANSAGPNVVSTTTPCKSSPTLGVDEEGYSKHSASGPPASQRSRTKIVFAPVAARFAQGVLSGLARGTSPQTGGTACAVTGNGGVIGRFRARKRGRARG